ncbi:apicomplexan specific [Cryptosporidium sp. chipmunk genotype I]|uniref:apicomplexan specific n=1 Tax=Cryptosporidium sp. chipmunk genotype I TaxID=1280935 RepID=UPI00351A0E43|nr:apicomplexan specific [Cryptosporidium sp. chipmunk genotype I]
MSKRDHSEIEDSFEGNKLQEEVQENKSSIIIETIPNSEDDLNPIISQVHLDLDLDSEFNSKSNLTDGNDNTIKSGYELEPEPETKLKPEPDLEPENESEDEEDGYEPYIKYLQALSLSWSSCQASSMLTKDLVEYMVPRFQDCSTPIKVRIIMSILYISDSLRESCKQEFMNILNFGELDRDDWVRKLSRLMMPYVQKGVLDLGETDTETAFKILRYLDELRMRENIDFRLKPPLESIHMCDPLTDESIDNELPCYNVDYDNFAPQKDFELLLAEVEKDGLHKMRMASNSFANTK